MKKIIVSLILTICFANVAMAQEPYLGEIRIFASYFAPKGWAFCNGQLLPINQYQALFSLLGTTYGGNGVTTFALPDLRGRVCIGDGNQHSLGERAGEATVTLASYNIPEHTHPLNVSSGEADSFVPSSSTALAGGMQSGTPVNMYYTPGTGETPTKTVIAPGTTSVTGGSQPHENMMPYTGVSFIIALQGIFPSQN